MVVNDGSATPDDDLYKKCANEVDHLWPVHFRIPSGFPAGLEAEIQSEHFRRLPIIVFSTAESEL